MYKSSQKDMLFEYDTCERLQHTLHKGSLGLDDKDLEVGCSGPDSKIRSGNTQNNLTFE